MKIIVFFITALVALQSCCGSGVICKKTSMPPFDYQGHRGSRGLLPENTIAAMYRAIDIGVTTLEMDVVLTQDGEPVVSHEAFFNHEISKHPQGISISEANEQQFNIFKMSLSQVQSFDVGLTPHPRFPQQQKLAAVKPSLAQLIDSVEAYALAHKKRLPQYNIEIKSLPETDGIFHPAPPAFVNAVMKVIAAKKTAARTTIQSFDVRPLQYVRANYTGQKLAYLVEPTEKQILALQLKQLGFIPDVYSPHHSLVTPAIVQQCHQMGMKIIPWTVNDLPTMVQLKKMGVDGLISDYPNIFIELSKQ
jgi:glycerophosphoryl diester phosphodiesterase